MNSLGDVFQCRVPVFSFGPSFMAANWNVGRETAKWCKNQQRSSMKGRTNSNRAFNPQDDVITETETWFVAIYATRLHTLYLGIWSVRLLTKLIALFFFVEFWWRFYFDFDSYLINPTCYVECKHYNTDNNNNTLLHEFANIQILTTLFINS